MQSSLISRRDLDFLLYEVNQVESLTAFDRFSDHNRETFDAVLDTAETIAREYFEPHAAKLDDNEPQFDGERVELIPEVGEALQQYYDAGFGAATQDYDSGGLQLPFTVSVAYKALFSAANVSTLAYASLSGANANVIKNFASQDLKDQFLSPLLEGRFTGTMALTEPQAGSSLADIRTAAVAQEEGHYLLTGNKVFISAGDHELSENIVHLVLARIKDAPAGVKGLSLFLVPKFLLDENGRPEQRNDVALGGLIHKMGYRGTTSTMLNFGEQGGATGYLVGEPHHGLLYMFQMMNEARIGVGVGAVALGYTAYLHALEYARERLQGRGAGSRDAVSPQRPIMIHTDVRRMLLAAKSYVEGGLCLSLYGATLADRKACSDDAAERERSAVLLDILTPILKSWPSKYCLEANSLAIQVHGGYGYTREYPLERLYRDNRLNPIHEGTEGIQSLDLLGRKVLSKNGQDLELLCEEMGATIAEAQRSPAIEEFADSLQEALVRLRETTASLLELANTGEMDRFLANSSLYLDVFGHTVVAWLWLQQAVAATNAEQADDFYQGKVMTCQYFFRRELPKTEYACQLLQAGDETCYSMLDEYF